jgi:hypothetical protein
MLLVDPEFRRLGVGRMLMSEALGYLGDCVTVKLDATELGKDLYRQLGFAEEYALQRLTHHCLPSVGEAPDEVVPVTDELLAQVIECDRAVFGADRALVLRTLFRTAPQSWWCLVRNGQVVGYCGGRPGYNFHQVGPLIADTLNDAMRLLPTALGARIGQPVAIDVPDHQTELLTWLAALGFVRQRAFVRMVHGLGQPHVPARQFSSVGPEFG